VYIHIDLTRVDLNEQERNRKLSAHESGVITFAQGRGENAAVDRASVNEDELLRPRLPAYPGAPDPPPNLDATASARGNFQQIVEKLGAIDIADPVAQRGHNWQLQRDFIFAHQTEANCRMSQSLQKKLMFDISRFRRFGAEKFSPCWHIVKQRTHFDLCPGRFAAVAHRLDPSAVYENFRASDGTVLARGQPKARNTGDARQRFAPKTKRADGREISRGSDFARGVPFK
jgi:hypothetical protein